MIQMGRLGIDWCGKGLMTFCVTTCRRPRGLKPAAQGERKEATPMMFAILDHRKVLRVLMLTLSLVAVFVAGLACTGQEASTASSGSKNISGSSKKSSSGKKVIVLGFDGMDPRMCVRLMDAGQLPRLNGLRQKGGFSPLGTSVPPQSPVAWSNFITGAGPGVHGIFDFIHRDPTRQCAPYSSVATTVASKDGWNVGDYRIPLTFWPFNHKASRTELKRQGIPFWDYLDKAGIDVALYDIPANYPPSKSKHGHVCCLSGMGVPDLLGGYGSYQHYSTQQAKLKSGDGGFRKPIIFDDNVAHATLTGPHNVFLKKPKAAKLDFDIYRHPSKPSVRIEMQGQTIVLNKGEWSDWLKVEFTISMPSFLPAAKVNGICRFYLQEVRPNFRLYVTPLNIDPSDPGEQAITEPPEFIEEIANELGLFYTTGFQEDHKALRNGVFTDEEYHKQADFVLAERKELLAFANKRYEDGLLFFYFSSTDVQAHMFWWDGDKPHPVRTPSEARKYNQVIIDLYKSMDKLVGDMLDRYGDEATVLVMSDHGFCNFRRQFNLNTWLRDEGYLNPPTCRSILDPSRGAMVDWSKTKAYGLGLNGLYINQRGRELLGIVDKVERELVLKEISEKLLAVRDPLTGEPVIKIVYRTQDIYHGPHADEAPDLIVGYHRGYRASWSTTMGNLSDEALSDNKAAWSADHCIAADEVPGVLFSNRPILKRDPSLIDLAPTILEEFGVARAKHMTGSSLFKATANAKVADRN